MNRKSNKTRQSGFSIPELVVVVFVIAIIGVLALPQISASRRAFRYASLQRQISATMSEARQQAMSQRRAITVRYSDSLKETVIFGGSYGNFGDGNNRIESLYGSGISQNEIVYGRPTGVPTTALDDSSNLTALSSGQVDITFQPDGSVLDAGNNPTNKAVFFYHTRNPAEMSFAVSVLGAGGRVKIWRFNTSLNKYVE
ncbi:MAG TPA: GspH/FimT family protein [Pyrinomonadaceae bacterium]|nr:GspH/FimT family protein [Pyrinomonadaceae bacterium]